MNIGLAIGDVLAGETALEQALQSAADHHHDEPDFAAMCRTLASECAQQRSLIAPFDPSPGPSEGPTGHFTAAPQSSRTPLLRDLRALLLLSYDAEIAWVVLGQLGNAIRDRPLLDAVCAGHEHAEIRCKWLRTRIKDSCTQALLMV